jgi:hypothetical protein
MRNTLDNSCRENQKHTSYVQKRFSEYRAIYEIMSKNVVEPEGPQMTKCGSYALLAE